MKRWFKSRTMWLNILAGLGNFLTLAAGLAATVAPQALTLLPTLGLAPDRLLIWTIGINAAVNVVNLYLRQHSPATIASSGDLEAFEDAIPRAGVTA